MENEQRVFLAYRAVFEGNNAQIRQPKAILKVVSKHRKSAQTLLQSLGEKQVLDTLKSLLERKVFQSELEAKLAFPNLFTTSLAQDVLHNASEADAARSQAEALEDMVSQEDEKDEALEATDEVPSVLNGAAGRLTYMHFQHPNKMSIAVPTQPIMNRIKSPSLYPVYIPYKIQHLVLTRAQQLLEECCYNFSTQWLPELLEQRRWDCKEAIELNKWTHAATKRLDKLPSSCFTAFANDSALSLANVLVSANELRHSAVHRLPTTAKGILEMVHSATRFARVLRDTTREEQFNELHRELEGKIRALELNKNFLETNLEQELQDIAKQRRELDKKEKEAIAVMLREDEDHGSLIGILLSDSVNHIFDESKNKGAEVTEAEQNSDHEIEGEEEQESASKYHSGHQLELNHPTSLSSVTDHDTKTKKNRSNQGHQPLAIAAQRLQPPAEPNASFDECQGNAYESKDGPNLQPGNDKSCFLYAQKQAIPAQELTECSPTNGDVDTGLETESGECEIGSQGCDEYSVPQEVHGTLSSITY